MRCELESDSVIRKFRITAADGKQYNTNHYNLDANISVGFRVNSKRATKFRQWATRVLREFSIKGYVLDRKRPEWLLIAPLHGQAFEWRGIGLNAFRCRPLSTA